MAGILISLGPKSNDYIITLQNTFEKHKALEPSDQSCGARYGIIKYKRKYEQQDTNIFKSKDLLLYVVGTLTYKGGTAKTSAKALGLDLINGKRLDQIIADIDGTFTLFVLSQADNTAYMITDAAGIINTYMYNNGKNIFVSSSFLSLARSFSVSVDEKSVIMFLRTGGYFHDRTCVEEIETLEPATVYTIDLKHFELSKKKYWEVPTYVDYRLPFKDAAFALQETLIKIMKTVPLEYSIFDFTGGYDSRFLLSLAYGDGYSKNDISAFFFGPRNSSEAKIIETACANLGIRYVNYELPKHWPNMFCEYVMRSHELTDGLENACNYATILWAQEQKRKDNFHHSINGLGGEIFRDKQWEFELFCKGKRKAANLNRLITYSVLAGDFDNSVFSSDCFHMLTAIPDELREIYKETNSIFGDSAPNTMQQDNIYLKQRLRRVHGRTITTSNQLIQCLSPYLFKSALSKTFVIPPLFKSRGKLMKHVAEQHSPFFAKQKMITGSPFINLNFSNFHVALPKTLFYSKILLRKLAQVFFNRTIWGQMTVPAYDVNHWYKKLLEERHIHELLSPESMVTGSIYDTKALTSFIENAKMPSFRFSSQLGNIITLELTLRKVLRDEI